MVSQSQRDYKILLISILGLRLNFSHIFISHMHFLFGGIVHSFALPSVVLNLFFLIDLYQFSTLEILT